MAVSKSCKARIKACSYSEKAKTALSTSASPDVTTALSLNSIHFCLNSGHRGEESKFLLIFATRQSKSKLTRPLKGHHNHIHY